MNGDKQDIEIPLNVSILNEFYSLVSSKNGIQISDFHAELERLFIRPRSDSDLRNYRLGRPPWKKLSDEITPVSQFLKFRGIKFGRIQFPLDDQPPDCWHWNCGEVDPVGIEVTIAQGTERYHLVNELVEKGLGRGFLGVSDDAPRAEFERRLSRPRIAYTTNQVLESVTDGIVRCLSRKNRPELAEYILLGPVLIK